MIVVSDTSPLLYLFLIDLIELLPQLYGQVIVPEAVMQEMTAFGTPLAFRARATEPPSWLAIKPVAIEITDNTEGLDVGEQAAISLTKSLRADLLLVDEKLGRRAAIAEELKIIGVIGILEEAANENLIDIRQAIAQLQQTNFRVSAKLIASILSRHNSN